jgi:hypothetical protein
MNQQPFKQWQNEPNNGMIAFIVLFVIGVVSAGYSHFHESVFVERSQFDIFLLYGGIVAIVTGLVGVIANSGK